MLQILSLTPVTSKYLAVVIKILNREGLIITSYFTERMRKGVVLEERNQIVMSHDKKAVSKEIDPYVLVRRDPKTKEILGITITNFTKYFETQKKLNIKVPAS